ncbi:MAG: hypothetical protein QNJ98_15610 [Planctomycetota bacterium]|nr:hypothetical protein [Planctomycetota bacterium]
MLRELWRRSPVLAGTAWLHAALAVLALALMPLDGREILGLDPWVKPFKFMVSIAIYLATLAWLVHYVRAHRRVTRWIERGTALAMLLETATLWMQSARGVRSHFNIETPFDGAVFGVMGIAIAISTLLELTLLWLFLKPRPTLRPTYLLGIRLGLFVFFLGSLVGYALVANQAHAIGVPDGGPGLPLLNWSTEGGDLRIAHAIGLHGLQVFPFVGWFLSRRGETPRGRTLLILTFVVYVGLLVATYLQARAGHPLLRIDL